MRSAVLVAPAPLDARTGGYIYDRRMIEGLAARGWAASALALDPSFPSPTPAALAHAAGTLAAIPSGTIVLIDSLALGAMPDEVAREASRLRLVALVHLPLAAAVGLAPSAAARLEQSERRALHAVSLVIVTGRAALPLLAPYDLPTDRIIVIEPGTDRPDTARLKPGTTYGLSRLGGPARAGHYVPNQYVVPGFSRALELLCVATLNAGKGHEALLAALASIPHTYWRLTCAGSLTRDPATVGQVRAAIARRGWQDRVTLAGDLDDEALEVCYARADLFVLATRRETYGMAVAEALAFGLPVVATWTGAIPDLVGEDAGLLVPVDDEAALADALTRAIGDADLRASLTEGARRRRNRLPTWDEAVDRMAAVLEPLVTHG